MTEFKNDGVLVQEYLYDFAVDGGAVGTIDLSDNAKRHALPVGAIVKAVHYRVLTAMTSGGAATLAIGDLDTAARYKAATAYNDAAYALNFVAAAAIGVPMLCDAANDGKFAVTIAGAALTAGKIGFYVEYFFPAN